VALIPKSRREHYRSLLAAATPGPWTNDVDVFDDEYTACVTDGTGPGFTMLVTIGTEIPIHESLGAWTADDSAERERRYELARESQAVRDASLIASAPTALAELLAENARLREMVREALALGDVPERDQDDDWYAKHASLAREVDDE
jgi:hypothetical protein